ncbi:VOC family protein [Marimonas arenosa]|uniref:VOC family protein n=1 Tax=Marimonas arenosa TaxID=1795305 RepID=A0AAE3WBL1_9RHOB|nr:VOC family protein [Marimonas arenosa]MDQ2090211.1 VOC family protein [Marimonas arenosa]
MSDNPVVHFEMPYDDSGRMREFYETAFGWTTIPLGPEMGDYVVAQAAETDTENMVTQKGAINGGFAPRSVDNDRTNLVIAVADIARAMADVEAAGGTVLGAPVEIAGVGLYVHFTDTEGNRLSLLEPTQ